MPAYHSSSSHDSLNKLIVPNMSLDLLREKVGIICFDLSLEDTNYSDEDANSIPDEIWTQNGTTSKDVMDLARIFIFQDMKNALDNKDTPGKKAQFVYLMDIFLSNDLNAMIFPKPIESLDDPDIFPDYERTFTRALVHFYTGAKQEIPSKQPSMVASREGIRVANILFTIDHPPLDELISNAVIVINWINVEGALPNFMQYTSILEKSFSRIEKAGGVIFLRDSESSEMRILEGAERVRFLDRCAATKFQVTQKDPNSLCITLIPQ